MEKELHAGIVDGILHRRSVEKMEIKYKKEREEFERILAVKSEGERKSNKNFTAITNI